jgi:hypothetical protein
MIALVWWLWRWRQALFYLAMVAIVSWFWLEARALKAEAALSRQRTSELLRVNRENLETIAGLRAERDAFDRAAADRDAAARALRAQIGSITRKALSHDQTKDCPVSPAIDDLLDGLSGPDHDNDAG